MRKIHIETEGNQRKISNNIFCTVRLQWRGCVKRETESYYTLIHTECLWPLFTSVVAMKDDQPLWMVSVFHLRRQTDHVSSR